MKFIPFPPRPKKNDLPSMPEEYPPKDGYENRRQLNVIARAILICATLVLFPPSPTPNYVKSDVTKVIERLDELIKNRLSEVGDITFESILKIKVESYKDSIENFTNKVIEESIKPERNLKNPNLWKKAFLKAITNNNSTDASTNSSNFANVHGSNNIFKKAFLKAITNNNSTDASTNSSNFANVHGSNNIFSSNQRNNI
ncbi:hypothetical protein Glove_221g44 [Diversispora epigaea]|uniref:Uncharacterized protein n=1 Tax=Diversispora epigaea TaxID=1348612 RepID=A0A397ILB6_9GLOM|nr:hypothetical protein Glove_221g44 [Diversispora epigaea]